MKETFLSWFGINNEEETEAISPDRAAAALMVEIMAVDHEWAQVEEAHIVGLLQGSFGFPEAEAKALVEQGKVDHAESNDLYRYTSVINEAYTADQKQQLLVKLWTVAYADGELDRYEEHMLRKLADLLHLPHSKYIQTKLTAREHMLNK